MSTRWYPVYQRGGPQLRIYLPNFWLKLIKPTHEQPPNVVQFKCSMEMTREDIKNYLEKIYGVKTMEIRTRIALGETRKDRVKGYVVKDEDIKYAYAVLPKTESFTFPDIFPNEKKEKQKQDERSIEEAKAGLKSYINKANDRPGAPGWFSF